PHPTPLSTLFPYTTLFRSYSETATPDDRALEPISSSRESAIVVIMPFSERAPAESASESNAANKGLADSSAHECAPAGTSTIPRSEEHTSELQSLAYLVCR